MASEFSSAELWLYCRGSAPIELKERIERALEQDEDLRDELELLRTVALH